MSIEPLNGFIIGTPCSPMKSMEAEIASAQGMADFVVVDSKAGRSDSAVGRTRVRLFNVVSANDTDDVGKGFVGKKMYCVCFENEKENNIVIDDKTGDKLFVIPTNAVIAQYKD